MTGCADTASRSCELQVRAIADRVAFATRVTGLSQSLARVARCHQSAIEVALAPGSRSLGVLALTLNITRRLRLVFLYPALLLASTTQAQEFVEAPRVVAALAQGQAAERGKGVRKSLALATEFYCDAATMGSSEGFFRIGRMLLKVPKKQGNVALANAYLALASRLGHREASMLHDPRVENARIDEICPNHLGENGAESFDVDGYIAALAPARRAIAAMIRKNASRYGVDVRLALGIALAESNLDTSAVSPKKAQGVMQLIPETQERFGVTKPFDPEQNIKGGLSYLRWLQNRYPGNAKLVIAAYNAGEGNVDRYGGIPPFPETQQYVRRVLQFSRSGGASK